MNCSVENAADVYRFVEDLKAEAKRHEASDPANQLENALRIGSSALEILGAIRGAVIDNRALIERLLGPSGAGTAKQVVAFVDKAFGR